MSHEQLVGALLGFVADPENPETMMAAGGFGFVISLGGWVANMGLLVATGQTGIFVADRGVAVDAVVSDFVAGAVEDMVVEAARDAEVVLVEGQGSIHHPGYSGVSLSLLHGACPDAMILCHQAGRTHIKTFDAGPAPRIRSLIEIVRDHERAAGWMSPARVLGVSLNTVTLDETEAKRAIDHEAQRTSLPVTDPVRYGAQPLATVIVRRLEERRRRAASA